MASLGGIMTIEVHEGVTQARKMTSAASATARLKNKLEQAVFFGANREVSSFPTLLTSADSRTPSPSTSPLASRVTFPPRPRRYRPRSSRTVSVGYDRLVQH